VRNAIEGKPRSTYDGSGPNSTPRCLAIRGREVPSYVLVAVMVALVAGAGWVLADQMPPATRVPTACGIRTAPATARPPSRRPPFGFGYLAAILGLGW
jgi:hypothetical protein